MQQLHRGMADQHGLVGGLRDHRIAGGERSDDLTGENRQREIPRADAHEHAATMQREFVRLAGRTGQRFGVAEQLARDRAVIAAHVGRFAHFGTRRRQRLTRFAHEQRDEIGAARFEQIGGVFEYLCARGSGQAIPLRLCRDGVAQRALDRRRVGLLLGADLYTAVGRIGYVLRSFGGFRAGHERRCAPLRLGRGDRVGERLQFIVVAEVDAHGIFPRYRLRILRGRRIR